MMKRTLNKKVDGATKEAWNENWQAAGINNIMQIFNYPRVQKQVAIYFKYLPKNKPILEGGCGLGPYLLYFRKLGYNVLGVDYNFDPLAKISANQRNIPLAQADVLNLPFPDNSLGAYLSLGVIEHFTQGPEKAIQEARRVLEPQGYFLVAVPNSSILQKIKFPVNCMKRNQFMRKILGKPEKKYYWEQYFKVNELAKEFRSAGFKIKEIIPVDHEHALMDFMGIFRQKDSYDAANKWGTRLGNIFERVAPCITAGENIFICQK